MQQTGKGKGARYELIKELKRKVEEHKAWLLE